MMRICFYTGGNGQAIKQCVQAQTKHHSKPAEFVCGTMIVGVVVRAMGMGMSMSVSVLRIVGVIVRMIMRVIMIVGMYVRISMVSM